MKVLLITNNFSSGSHTQKWSLAFGSLLYTDLNAPFLCSRKKRLHVRHDGTNFSPF